MFSKKPPQTGKTSLQGSFVKKIAFSGQIMGLIVILQTSTMFLPFMGDFFSHFTPLLLAVAIAIAPGKGVSIALGASILLLFFAPKQIPILLFFDGPLGLWLGLTHHHPNRKFLYQLLATANLLLGVYLLSAFLGIPLLGGIRKNSSSLFILSVTGTFIFLYVRTWLVVSLRCLEVMGKRGLLSTKESGKG